MKLNCSIGDNVKELHTPGMSLDSGLRAGLFNTQLHLQILHEDYIAKNTSILNKYGPGIIKNSKMRIGRPLLKS